MSLLVNQYGSPLRGSVYRTPSKQRTEDKPRPRNYQNPEAAKNLSQYDKSELIQASRALKALPLICGAIRQKAMWACGDWGVKFIGENKEWGKLVAEDIRNTGFNFCTPNFENYNFQQMLKVTSEAQDTDGSQLNVWTRYGTNQFPQVRIVEATMISSGNPGYSSTGSSGTPYETINGRTRVKGGKYDGAWIDDGQISDRDGRRLATRGWGYDDKGNVEFSDIPAEFSQMLFEPNWANGNTSAPKMAASVCDLLRGEDIKEWLTTAIGVAARLAITRTTDDAMPVGAERTETNYDVDGNAVDMDGDPTTVTQQITQEAISAGIYELKGGEGISQVPFARPSMEEEKFLYRINAEALWSIGIPIQVFDPAAMGRAGARAVKEVFRMGIWERQQTLERMTFGYLRWYISKRIANGDLPANNTRAGADAYMWRVELPAEYTVDEGNDRAADLNDIKMGAKSRSRVLSKCGEDFEAVDEELFIETVIRAEKAAKLAAQFPQRDFNQWMDFMEQRGPNAMQTPAPAAVKKPAAAM